MTRNLGSGRSRVETWRGGLGCGMSGYPGFPFGAQDRMPCSVSTSRSSNRTCRGPLRIIPHRGRTEHSNPTAPIALAGAQGRAWGQRRSARPQPSRTLAETGQPLGCGAKSASSSRYFAKLHSALVSPIRTIFPQFPSPVCVHKVSQVGAEQARIELQVVIL